VELALARAARELAALERAAPAPVELALALAVVRGPGLELEPAPVLAPGGKIGLKKPGAADPSFSKRFALSLRLREAGGSFGPAGLALLFESSRQLLEHGQRLAR
jgi:hypothetical protein